MNKTRPQVNEALCTLCGLCVTACPCGAVALQERGVFFACPESCAAGEESGCTCGCICEEVCPTGAISCTYEIILGDGSGAL